MTTFPLLKSGASAQYPLATAVRFKTQTVEFLDGSRQQYALQGKALRTWTLKLDLLDDREFAAIAAFVDQASGGPFLFTDPATGEDLIRCILAGEEFSAVMKAEMTGEATLVIREII